MELLRNVTLRLQTLVVQSGDFVGPMLIIVHAQNVSTTDHKSKKLLTTLSARFERTVDVDQNSHCLEATEFPLSAIQTQKSFVVQSGDIAAETRNIAIARNVSTINFKKPP